MSWFRKPSALSATPTSGSREPVFVRTPEEQARYEKFHSSNQFGV